jgi:hypothetical protein
MKTDARFPYALLLCVASLGSLIPVAAAQTANNDSTAAVQPRDQQEHHDPGTRLQLSQSWQESIRPLLQQRCFSCHNTTTQEGQLDLSIDQNTADVINRQETYAIVLQRLVAEEMPPADAPDPMTADERKQLITWLNDVRNDEAQRHAGDPGLVLARRLSNAEYDYSVRDLTGVDIRPTREFPIDPANTAGFDNSGESLTMSPALLTKYLGAAQHVADHLVLTPRGLIFAPHPVISETDRDKFCVQRIVDFYDRHAVNYADYFLALWKYEHRDLLNRPKASLAEFAEDAGLSPRYLATLQQTLAAPEERGPIKELQTAWAELPTDLKSPYDPAAFDPIRTACERLSQLVQEIRKDLDDPVPQLKAEGISAGSQPIVLWWNRKLATRRMMFPGDGEDAALDAARNRFCQVFPNEFAVSSRGHYSDGNLGAGVRLLSAGFHLMHGYFRDDRPLYELVLNDPQRTELDELWEDLNYVALAPVRQYKDFLFFERAEPPQFAAGVEFDFARAEDKDATSEAKLTRMLQAYVKRAREINNSPEVIEAVETYFAEMSQDFRWIESVQATAEARHIEALVTFAQNAWRRPLTNEEKNEINAFYRRLRDQEGLSHDDAVRDSVASILMSPHFSWLYSEMPDEAHQSRSTTTSDHVASDAVTEVRPLTSYELASRLSYFLWASLPDAELLAHAADDSLQQHSVLKAQVRRMLRDVRARGLATEFLGNWLEFRRFEEHNSVDRERFPAFTAELRSAMYEEPIRFFVDLIQENRSVLSLLKANYTFVNRPLAAHYGIEIPALSDSEDGSRWVRVDPATRYGRGGLLPMAVFLTKNSPGLRTSPVKRGYWVARRLLGEYIPPPPPNVPELPQDEASLGDQTLAQLLERHRSHAACAGCHQRFDSMGLVFEGFGPVGETRALDLSGHPVQTAAVFPDGTTADGPEDLRRYLLIRRHDDFVDHFVRQLFTYGLGRSLKLSDTSEIKWAKVCLTSDDYQFHTLVDSIVTSPQFLNRRIDSRP